MSDWGKIEKYFGSYADKIKPFWESGEMVKIQEFLKLEKSKGKKLYPAGDVIFRALTEVDIDKIKVLFLGLSPYTALNCADGLAFSCSKTKVEQPSLSVLLTALENDLGYKDTRNPDLSRWCKSGVMLLNSALTITNSYPVNPREHLEIWKPFIQYFFEKVINDKEIIIVFFGKDAKEYLQYTNPEKHHIFLENHPAYFARKSENMYTSIFSRINEILKDKGNSEVQWMEYGDLPFEKMEKQVYEEFI